MIDPQLAYDAAQMAILKEHPAWVVLSRYVEMNRDLALNALCDKRRPMEEIRYSQGAIGALDGVLGLPNKVIAEERNSRGD